MSSVLFACSNKFVVVLCKIIFYWNRLSLMYRPKELKERCRTRSYKKKYKLYNDKCATLQHISTYLCNYVWHWSIIAFMHIRKIEMQNAAHSAWMWYARWKRDRSKNATHTGLGVYTPWNQRITYTNTNSLASSLKKGKIVIFFSATLKTDGTQLIVIFVGCCCMKCYNWRKQIERI